MPCKLRRPVVLKLHLLPVLDLGLDGRVETQGVDGHMIPGFSDVKQQLLDHVACEKLGHLLDAVVDADGRGSQLTGQQGGDVEDLTRGRGGQDEEGERVVGEPFRERGVPVAVVAGLLEGSGGGDL